MGGTMSKHYQYYVDVNYLGKVYSLPQVRNRYSSDPMFYLVITDCQETKQVVTLCVQGLCCRLDVWGIDNHYDYSFSIPFTKIPSVYYKEIE